MPLEAVSCTYRGFIVAYARPFFPGHLVGTSTREGREDSYGVGKVTLLTELLARTQRLAGEVRTHRRSIHLHPLGQLGLRGEASARWRLPSTMIPSGSSIYTSSPQDLLATSHILAGG